MAEPHISGYRLDRLLGRGGFASVYLAAAEATNEAVALKVLYEHTTDPADLKRFERERLSLAALAGHPHIVGILDFGTTDDGHHYLVLEYVDGGSLSDRLAAGGAMHWSEVTTIGVQICSALDAAHRAGVLHRDLKPANILLGPQGAKLGDFGIARLVGQSQLTAAQSIVGTLAYTPPEILHNHSFDGRGDIYQLGITLYELLLGRAPFKSGSADNKAMVIRRILENPAPSLAQFDIPAPLSDLLDEVLAKDPADRPQTADSFGRRLNEVQQSLGLPPTEIHVPLTAANEATLAVTAPTHAGAATGPDSTGFTTLPPTPAVGDETVVERQPSDSTRVLPSKAAPGPDEAPTPEPAPTPRPRPGVGVALWGLLAVGVIGALAGVLWWLLRDGDETTAPPDGDGVDVVDPIDSELPNEPTMVRIDQPAFGAPGGRHGIIFGAVANTQGLTVVGGVGEGQGTDQQRSTIWTMRADGHWDHQELFASASGQSAAAQRLRGIGVIDGEQLLAVGEAINGRTLDGVAWIGQTVRAMIPLEDASYSGSGRQRLLNAVGDAVREEFIVVGERAGPATSLPGLWLLRPEPSWEEPTWSVVEIGGGVAGLMTDAAVAGDLAVVVGYEELANGSDQGLVLIRRDDVWVNLLQPIPDTQLNSVDFFGDRIVAVGTRSEGSRTRPVAVVADVTGIGFVHTLPTADALSGKAHDVVETAAGVFAVGLTGEVEGIAAFTSGRTDGALWELLPGETAANDVWTTRDTDELRVDGFQEFWSVVEYDGRVFALGTADGDAAGETVAAAWTVTVDGSRSDPPSREVEDAQADAAPDDTPTDVESGDAELGTTPEGCAVQAVADVRTDFDRPDATLEPVLVAATDEFALWICADETGGLWYHGAQRDGDLFITLPAEEVPGGYRAENAGTIYRIVDGRLTVQFPSGTIDVDQPLIGDS